MANAETKSPRANKVLLDSTGQAAASAANDTQKAAESTASATKSMADAAFSMPQFQVPEAFRSFAEQGLNQTRDAYSRIKGATEEATDMMEESFETARDSMREVQLKALDAAKDNADATFDFVRKLLTVTSVADAVQMQTAFARERFEAMVDYSKDVQSTITKVSTEAAKPARAMMDRALNQTKAA